MSHSDDENAGNRNRDSFDLETQSAPSAPPNYKEVLSETADHEHASNTLFELDDEDGTATKGE